MKTRKLFSTMLALLLALCIIAGGGFVQVAYALDDVTVDNGEVTASDGYEVNTTGDAITVDGDDTGGDELDSFDGQPAATAGITASQGIMQRSGDFVIIDLDDVDISGGSGYTVDTIKNIILVEDTASIGIRGDGTNGGNGWTIIIEDVKDVNVNITIAAGTTILGTALEYMPALEVPFGARIQGMGPDITITGRGNGITAIGDLWIHGVIGSITGGNNGIYADGHLTITGNIRSISGSRDGIYAGGGVTTSGTLGDISGGNNGIFASGGDVSILLMAGNITGGMNGICAKGGDVGIYGRIGNITATSQEEGSGVGISGKNVTIRGTVGDISASSYGILANSGGDITISENGKVGDVSGGINGIDASGNVVIKGTVGVISGGTHGIVALDTFTIDNNSVVYTSSLSPGTTVSDMSQGILFVGNEGTVYGDVTLGGNLTVTADQTLTVPDGASLTIPSGVTLTNNGRIQNNGTIRNNGRITSRDGGFRGASPTGNPVQYPPPSYDNGSRSSSSDGGSSGGGTTQATAAPANVPVNVTQAAAMTATQNAIAAARAASSTVATVNFRNPGEIGLSTLQAMANAARQAGMTLRLQADSMAADNRAVDVRITLTPAQSTQNLNLSASTTNAGATRTTSTFTRFFSNNVMTVSLGQQGGFGQTVTIAAKLNPGLNTDNLAFYVYDRTANTFRRIQSPNYRVDANGYVHFDTAMGGEIVISDGALLRR